MAGKYFWQKLADDSVCSLRVKNFIEISLSRTISEINVFLHFMQKFKMATKRGMKMNFWQTVADDSVNTLQVKNFVEITLSLTISEINAFLHFKQKFKMAAKNGGKTIFGKKLQINLHIPCGSKISSKSPYLLRFSR